MNTSKTTYTVALISCALVMSCSKTVYTATELKENFKADGNASEWETPFSHYDAKSKLQYAIANDHENLYVCIKASDQQTQMKMIMGGMNIYLDAKGKKSEATFLAFPLAKQGGQQRQMNPGKRPDVSKMKRDFVNSLKEMHLTGFFNPVQNGITPLQNKYGINVALDWDANDILIYEAVIPLKTFFKNELTASDTLSKIGIGIKLNGIEIPQMLGGGGMPPGGMGGGPPSGGMPGGGRPGGGRPAGAGTNNTLFEANKIWMHVKLNWK